METPRWKRCEIYSKLTIKTPERRHWCCSGAITVNFEHFPHLFLMFLLLLWTSNCLLRSGRICKPLVHKKYPSDFDVTEYSKDTLNWFRSFNWSARASWKWSVKFKDVIRTLWDIYDRTFLRKDRNSHLRCSIKNGVLRNLAKFTAKHLCQSF